MLAAPVLALALSASALAYETDQLTDRDEPLRDAGPIADAMMNVLLDDALARANERVGCSADDATLHRAVAREVFDATATNMHVPRRGPIRGMGAGRLAALLEQVAGVDRRPFDDRSDIYGELTWWHSVILATAGVCSTIRLHGIDVGTDKVDHFVEEGFVYFRVSRWGADPQRALKHGTGTERGTYGLVTSKAFSFGDLAANHAGYRFYDGLLGPDSVVARDEAGCAARVADFSFADWVEPSWDEVLSPNVYTPLVQRGLDRVLDARQDELCASYAAWGEGYEAALNEVLATPSPDVAGKSPERVDPYRIVERCGPLE
jgi:hypothetical protein